MAGWAAAIQAGAQLLGGLADQKQASVEQGRMLDLSRDQMQLQKEMAQNGITWRVADAKQAGIHPLFALGAQLPNYSPVSTFPVEGSDRFSNIGRDMGQDLTRAIDATRNGSQRVDARLDALKIERAELENKLLSSQIAKLNQVGPAQPSPNLEVIPGQGDTRGLITTQPMERTFTNPNAPHQEPGAVGDVGFARTDDGYVPVPSKDVKERIEDMAIPEMQWSFRNNLIPSYANRPPEEWLKDPARNEWRWNPISGRWQERPARFHKREIYRGTID